MARTNAPPPLTLVSLAMAAKILAQATTKQGVPDETALDACARSIAARTPVFAIRPEAKERVLVLPSEIAEGEIEAGGALLTFSDGRAPLVDLAIVPSELDRLLEEIRDSG
jgi:hypothetical protein